MYFVKTKILDKLKFWPDGGAVWKVMGLTKVITIYPEENVNQLPCTKLDGNPGYFSLHQKCEPHNGTGGEVRESPKLLGFILWASWVSICQIRLMLEKVSRNKLRSLILHMSSLCVNICLQSDSSTTTASRLSCSPLPPIWCLAGWRWVQVNSH